MRSYRLLARGRNHLLAGDRNHLLARGRNHLLAGGRNHLLAGSRNHLLAVQKPSAGMGQEIGCAMRLLINSFTAVYRKSRE